MNGPQITTMASSEMHAATAGGNCAIDSAMF